MARNRYGWQKRAKEMARKEKSDEKIKRRQGKTITSPAEESPVAAEDAYNGPDETGLQLRVEDPGEHIL